MAQWEASGVAIEAYIPTEATYEHQTINDPIVFTLYHPYTNQPHGALTTRCPLAAGERGGPLVVTGARDGKRWRVSLPEIEVFSRTTFGCEFRIYGQIVREVLSTDQDV